MIYRANLEKMRTNLNKRIKFVRKEIHRSPQGYLLKTKHGERDEYIHVFYRKGKRIRKRVKYGSEIMNRLLHKMILEIELEILEKNYMQICDITDKYIEFSTKIAEERLPANLVGDYLELIELEAKAQPAGVGSGQSTFMPEGRTHITSRGLRVRSKSEVLIVEKLYEYEIEFRYEEVLQVGKHTIVPDFTIGRRDGKVFYWEHCGRTQDAEYMRHHRWKMGLYEGVGIVPWDNLIVTYDDEEGNINLAAVEGEIKAKLLV